MLQMSPTNLFASFDAESARSCADAVAAYMNRPTIVAQKLMLRPIVCLSGIAVCTVARQHHDEIKTVGWPEYGKSSARYAGTTRRDARHEPTQHPPTQAYSLPYGPRRLHFSRRLCSGRRLRRRVSRDRRLGARPTPSRRARLKRTAYRREPTAASRAGRRRDRHRDRAHLGSPTVYHQAAGGSRKGVAALIRAFASPLVQRHRRPTQTEDDNSFITDFPDVHGSH